MPLIQNVKTCQHNHRVVKSNIHPWNEAQAAVFNNKNEEALKKSFLASGFVPVSKDNYVASIYLIGTKSQYANFPKKPNIMLLEKWALSLKETGVKGILFHNCFTEQETNKFPNITWIRVGMPPSYMSGLYRFFIYKVFMDFYGDRIENIFFTDSTDLDLLKNPFIQPSYKTDVIYIGCEPVVCGNKWMLGACDGYPQYVDLVKKDHSFADSTLLNAGLVGGNAKTIKPFIEKLAIECSKMYPVAGVQDMPILNYLAYTEFADKISFGRHLNTVFTGYEKNNTFAWVRHK